MMIVWLVLAGLLGLIGAVAWYLDANSADMPVTPADPWQQARATYAQHCTILSWSSQVFQRNEPLVQKGSTTLSTGTVDRATRQVNSIATRVSRSNGLHGQRQANWAVHPDEHQSLCTISTKPHQNALNTTR